VKRAWNTSAIPGTGGRQAVTSDRPVRPVAETATSRTYKTSTSRTGDRPDVPADNVRFDTRIAVLLRDDLQPWQRLNVTAFVVSGLAATRPELIGEPYADADDTAYLPMFRQPVLVLVGSKEVLTAAHARALSRGIALSVFTADLFATGHDAANRAAVRAVPRADLDLVGLALHAPRGAADKIVKGARLHP
jgi:hypothetical protein